MHVIPANLVYEFSANCLIIGIKAGLYDWIMSQPLDNSTHAFFDVSVSIIGAGIRGLCPTLAMHSRHKHMNTYIILQHSQRDSYSIRREKAEVQNTLLHEIVLHRACV